MLECALAFPGGLVKHSRWAPSQVFHSVGLGEVLRICISNKFPGDAVNHWINKVVINQVPTKTSTEEISVGEQPTEMTPTRATW